MPWAKKLGDAVPGWVLAPPMLGDLVASADPDPVVAQLAAHDNALSVSGCPIWSRAGAKAFGANLGAKAAFAPAVLSGNIS